MHDVLTAVWQSIQNAKLINYNNLRKLKPMICKIWFCCLSLCV